MDRDQCHRDVYLVELGERILFVRVVVDASPVRKRGRVASSRILELDEMPSPNTVTQISLGMLVDFGLLGGYERRLVRVVLAHESPHLPMHALRPLDRLD